jgi:hypothetical protein
MVGSADSATLPCLLEAQMTNLKKDVPGTKQCPRLKM